jgi:hypothetical protein
MGKLFAGAGATIFCVYILIKAIGLMGGGGSDVARLQSALASIDPARPASIGQVIDVFNDMQVELTRDNIDRTVKATIALRDELGIDLRLFSNLNRARDLGHAFGKTLAKDSDRVGEIVKKAGFEGLEDYFKTLGTIAALYPTTVIASSEKKIHEEFAKVPAQMDQLKTMAPAMAAQIEPMRRIVDGYTKFVMAKPGNIKMILANKGKIETAIGRLDKATLEKMGARALMGG